MDVSVNQFFQRLEETNKVNPYTIYELQELLEENTVDFEEMERLCFSIVTNLFDDNPLLELQNNDRQILWYDYLRLQIYVFLKGKGDYGDNHSVITASSAIIVENMADELFARFGIDDKLIPLVVSLILCVAVKVSAEAWCGYFYDKIIRNSELLQSALKEMTNTNDSGEV